MKVLSFSFKSSSNLCDISCKKYIPSGEIKGIFQIIHGMTEYFDRYEDFAKFLCENGYVVVGNDLLGHGLSIVNKSYYGYFAKEDGYKKVLEDAHTITKMMKEEFPNKPYYLLGHSMGSFFARNYLFTYPNEVDKAIIMGTGQQSNGLISFAKLLCKTIGLFKGEFYRSKLIANLTTGNYYKRIDNPKTVADWLTKDEEIVDKYVNDERCTFIFTINGYYNMFDLISSLLNKDNLNKMNKDLNVLFVAGAQDPVGDYGKGVIAAADSFKEVGMKNVDLKLYEEDRHEILNELDKKDVYGDILNWLEK